MRAPSRQGRQMTGKRCPSFKDKFWRVQRVWLRYSGVDTGMGQRQGSSGASRKNRTGGSDIKLYPVVSTIG
jgi:hypothetical protein